MSTPPAVAVTSRTRLRRLPDRGRFDRQTIDAILDEGFICHLAFAVDGQAYAVPTGYARVDDRIYLHGSAASRLVRAVSGGLDVCFTVTLLDGLVLARSAFHHSVNYRSVMVLGQARLVTDAAERLHALRRLTDHIVPGRWAEVREPNERELKGTAVLALDIVEASAKVRSGPPVDDEEDYEEWPVWAGVVPLAMVAGEPRPDGRVAAGAGAFDTARLAARGKVDGSAGCRE